MTSMVAELLAQTPPTEQEVTLEAPDSRREEIQRYFGYEDLLYRYITIPYDMTMQTNQQGRFIDIGYALFALLPIALLVFCYRRKKLFYTVLISTLLYLCLCFRYSFIRDNLLNTYNPNSEDLTQVASSATNWTHHILSTLYSFGGAITKPIIALSQNWTGTFTIISVLIKKVSVENGIFWITGCIYFFLWWVLSGGIIWYGLLMIPLGYILITKATKYLSIRRLFWFKPVVFLPVMISYLVLAYIVRISNISTYQKDHPSNGYMMIDHRIFPYMTGQMDYRQSLHLLSPNLPVALDRINSDNNIIYQCGSSLNYEIKNNNKRILEDNSLSYFLDLTKKYPSRSGLTDFFVKRGVKYFIVDLKLPTLDRTPEKTLIGKYKLLMYGYLKDNPSIKLVATDQVVRIDQADGSIREFSAVFGNQIVTLGSYAVFEII